MSADLGDAVDPGLESPPESPPMSALTGGSPHSRPGETQGLIPVDGAMVQREGPTSEASLAGGCGTGTTNTNAAFVAPPVAPVATDVVRENDAFEGVEIDSVSSGTPVAADGMHVNRVFEGADDDDGTPAALVATNGMYANRAFGGAEAETHPAAAALYASPSPLPDDYTARNTKVVSGVLRQGVAGDSATSLTSESAALTSPLFANPLFTDAGGVVGDGCFSKLPNDASGDVILAKILSCLLDSDYPSSGAPHISSPQFFSKFAVFSHFYCTMCPT